MLVLLQFLIISSSPHNLLLPPLKILMGEVERVGDDYCYFLLFVWAIMRTRTKTNWETTGAGRIHHEGPRVFCPLSWHPSRGHSWGLSFPADNLLLFLRNFALDSLTIEWPMDLQYSTRKKLFPENLVDKSSPRHGTIREFQGSTSPK